MGRLRNAPGIQAPEQARRPLPALLILTIGMLAVAGCLGSEGPEPVNSSKPSLQNATGEAGSASWFLKDSVQIDQTVGVGVPHTSWVSAGVQVVCPNGDVEIRLPDQASFLSIELNEPAVNTSSAGVGFGTFIYRNEGGEWRDPEGDEVQRPTDPYGEPPSEATTVNVSEPVEGLWQVEVWPHGLVVNQQFDLTVHARGTGPPVGNLADTSRFGASCGG